MSLSSRFAIDTTTVVAGGFLTVAALTFAPLSATWIGFGVFAGLVVLGGLGLALDRHLTGRLLHGLLAVVGAWSLIATLLFVGTPLTWLVVGGALAAVVLGLGDLAAHEVTTERVVHQLEVTETSDRTPVGA